jgi:hypothetical protein
MCDENVNTKPTHYYAGKNPIERIGIHIQGMKVTVL